MSRRTSSSVRTSRGLKLAVADRRTGAARNCALDHPTKISKRSRHNFNECIGIAAYSRCFVPVARNFGNDESMAFKSSSCRCLLFIQIFVGNVVLQHLVRCVRTSLSSESAASTPLTTAASNGLPSSSNSATLSESGPWSPDNPCKSPDWRPERTPGLFRENATVSALWFFFWTFFSGLLFVFAPIVLRAIAFVFTAGLFRPAFFAARFLGVSFFLLAAVVFDFVRFVVLFSAGID